MTIPPMHYAAVRGEGDPNAEGSAYQQAIRVLYAVSRMLKTSWKKEHEYIDYVVPPLEGFWRQDGTEGVDYTAKEKFQWISAIRLPDFVAEEDIAWAVEEGLCVQTLHAGPFEGEAAAVAAMDAYLREAGYENGLSESRLHHEIYLSDARKTAPKKWRTVIRHPIKKRKM